DGHAGGGFARAGALDHLAHVVLPIFERAGKVGVSGPHTCDWLRRLGWRLLAHAILPVGPVAILDAQRDRRAERVAVAHAGEHLGGVVLDLHASAAPVA